MKSDDHKLIAAFQSGDQHAFDTLYRQYAGRVLAFVCQMTGDVSDAEDITQEVFLGAFKGLHSFRQQSNVLTWLFSIAVRRWRDRQRHAQLPTVPYPNEAETRKMADVSKLQSDPLRHNADLLALQKVMSGLNAPLREAFLLVVVQELTHREAAQVLACPLGTVKWRVAEGLRQVRAGLQSADTMSKPVQFSQETEEAHVPCLLP